MLALGLYIGNFFLPKNLDRKSKKSLIRNQRPRNTGGTSFLRSLEVWCCRAVWSLYKGVLLTEAT